MKNTVVYSPAAPLAMPDLDAAAAFFHSPENTGKHWVVVSSAAVHEASHRHMGLHREEPLTPLRHGNKIAVAWRRFEKLAKESVPAENLTILRPTAMIGRDDALGRLFKKRWALVPPGYDPTLQLLSPEDLQKAIERASEEKRPGIFHVAPSGGVHLSAALRAAKVRRLPLNVRHRSSDAYLRFNWTVDYQKAREELAVEPAANEGDVFGMDEEYIGRFSRGLFRFLHDTWWRVEWRGLEHVPRQGRAVLTGVHRGFMPWDGVMALHLISRELGRYPRFLIHPTLIKHPVITPYILKLGGVPACRENADRILGKDEILGIFPEGVKGAFSLYRDAYKLGRFGRDEYVKAALRNQAPIVPFVTVGSAEVFPILRAFHWRWFKRWSEWPFFPITPTMGLVPLPSKWHTLFLPPMHVEREYPPEAAKDPEVVSAISAEVQDRMLHALTEMRRRRPGVFWGRIFDKDIDSLEEEWA